MLCCAVTLYAPMNTRVLGGFSRSCLQCLSDLIYWQARVGKGMHCSIGMLWLPNGIHFVAFGEKTIKKL